MNKMVGILGNGEATSKRSIYNVMQSRVKPKEVQLARALFLIVLCSVLWNLNTLDGIVYRNYEWIRQQWWFQHDSFEPLLATASFATWLFTFQLIDTHLPLKKYLLDPVNRKVDYHTGVPVRSGLVYLVIILGYDFLFPRRKLPLDGPGSFASVCWQILSALFLYDLLFFPIHVALHNIPKLRQYHQTHHVTKSLYSTEVLRHSFVDGSLQVLMNIAALNILKLHPYSRLWYNIVVTYLLTESHSGYDLPWMPHNIVPYQLLGGPVRHEYHHKTGNAFFQQFFTYLDDYVLPLIIKLY